MMINQWSLSGRSSPSRLCRVGSLNARLVANVKAAWEHDIDGMAKPGALEPRMYSMVTKMLLFLRFWSDGELANGAKHGDWAPSSGRIRQLCTL